MDFKQILHFMKTGYKAKLPGWGGYWELNREGNGIVMHTKDGEILNDCTERLFYTIENVLSDEWMIADEKSTPILGGEALMDFGNAIRYAQRGFKIARKVWENRKDGRYIRSWIPPQDEKIPNYIYLIKGNEISELFFPSQGDMLAKDWYILEDYEQ